MVVALSCSYGAVAGALANQEVAGLDCLQKKRNVRTGFSQVNAVVLTRKEHYILKMVPYKHLI